jgi:hypothetical protein
METENYSGGEFGVWGMEECHDEKSAVAEVRDSMSESNTNGRRRLGPHHPSCCEESNKAP